MRLDSTGPAGARVFHDRMNCRATGMAPDTKNLYFHCHFKKVVFFLLFE